MVKDNGPNWPKISIVTVVLNNAEFIENCICSVLEQDYPNLEYIVIDGESTDGTTKIIEKYRDKLSFYVSEKDKGQTNALNKGFAKATGDVFAWLNADETYLPGTLRKVGNAFARNEKLDFVFGNRIVVDCEGREIGTKVWPPMHPKWHLLYRMNVLPTDASFWSSGAHQQARGLDEKHFPRLSMDYDWLLRLSFFVKDWAYFGEYLATFTEREDRVSNVGMAQDGDIALKSNFFARHRAIAENDCTKLELFVGWLLAGIWARIFERRLNLPSIALSLRRLFLKNIH